MLPPLTFREIFILLTSDDVQNYALKNYTKTPYRGQKLGHKAMIPLGGPLVIEYLLGIARSSQQRILDYYSGKTDKLPEPLSISIDTHVLAHGVLERFDRVGEGH